MRADIKPSGIHSVFGIGRLAGVIKLLDCNLKCEAQSVTGISKWIHVSAGIPHYFPVLLMDIITQEIQSLTRSTMFYAEDVFTASHNKADLKQLDNGSCQPALLPVLAVGA